MRALEERPESPCIYHLYPVRVADRGAFAAELSERGVSTGVHYSPAVPDQPPFAALPGGPFPVASAWAAEELSLPMFEGLTPAEVEQVAEACVAAAAALPA